MRKLMLISVMAIVILVATGCRAMHPTVAEGVIQWNKNTQKLLGNYKAVLGVGDDTTTDIDKEHEIALIDATLDLATEMNEIAEDDKGIEDLAKQFIEGQVKQAIKKLKEELKALIDELQEEAKKEEPTPVEDNTDG